MDTEGTTMEVTMLYYYTPVIFKAIPLVDLNSSQLPNMFPCRSAVIDFIRDLELEEFPSL